MDNRKKNKNISPDDKEISLDELNKKKLSIYAQFIAFDTSMHVESIFKILNEIIQYGVDISSSEFDNFINVITKSKTRSYLHYYSELLLPIFQIMIPTKSQMDKIMTIFSQKHKICYNDGLDYLVKNNYEFTPPQIKLLDKLSYHGFDMYELVKLECTKEIFLEKVSKINSNTKLINLSDEHSDIITSCIKRNNIVCDTELFDILSSEKISYKHITKYKININQHIIDKCIEFDLKDYKHDLIIELIKKGINFTIKNIKDIVKCVYPYHNFELFNFFNEILKIIKTNECKKEDIEYIINNLEYYNEINYDTYIEKNWEIKKIPQNENKTCEITKHPKISHYDVDCVYANIFNIYIKFKIEPTEDTLIFSIKSRNKLLKTFCMHKELNVSHECFREAINSYKIDDNFVEYFLNHKNTVLDSQHLAIACRYHYEYVDMILDAKITPDYNCAKACVYNLDRLKKMCDNGLKIDEQIIELFIKNNIPKYFLVNANEDIIFDICHNMGYNPFDYIDGEHIKNKKIYKILHTCETDEPIDSKYKNLDEYIFEHIETYHMEYDKYVYDLLLEHYVCDNEFIMLLITNAVTDGRYKITITSISRIENDSKRYTVAKKFGHLINKN